MKNSIRLISSVCFALTILLTIGQQKVTAQTVDFKTVQIAAFNAFTYFSGKNASEVKLQEVLTVSNDENIYYYVFNFKDEGFVIMSNNYMYAPVLGVCDNTTFHPKTVPPALDFLLDEIKQQMDHFRNLEAPHNNTNKDEWLFYINYPDGISERSYIPGNWLMQTEWDQDNGFNQLIPNAPSGCKPPVGCVGVSLGQILKYWSCQVFPDDEITYTPWQWTSPVSVKFWQQTYNWDAMSNLVVTPETQKLLFHAAASIETDFSCNGSAGYAYLMRDGLSKYWGFTNSGIKYKTSYNLPVWMDMLNYEIDNGRPIAYFGQTSANTVGHSWVIDGYQGISYHCNWGYGGDYNGFFMLACLDPGPISPDFSSNQRAIMNIQPILNSCSDFYGTDLLCNGPPYSYSIPLPDLAKITWTASPNINILAGVNDPDWLYVLPYNPNQSNSGFIKANIYNSRNILFKTITKNVWISKPLFTVNTLPNPVKVNQRGDTYVNYSITSDQKITSWSWSRTGPLQSSIGQKTQYTFLGGPGTGVATVTATQTNGCGSYSATSTFNVVANLAYYPNPAVSELNLELLDPEEGSMDNEIISEVQIWDMTMNNKKTVKINNRSTTINVSDLDPNVYIIRVITDKNVYDDKLIISHQ